MQNGLQKERTSETAQSCLDRQFLKEIKHCNSGNHYKEYNNKIFRFFQQEEKKNKADRYGDGKIRLDKTHTEIYYTFENHVISNTSNLVLIVFTE